MSLLLFAGRPPGAGTPVDPYFSSVTLLFGNDNAANGTTTFLDQSGTPKTLTRTGGAIYTSTSPPTGMTTSVAFDGAGDGVLSDADANILNVGTGDFTIDGWINVSNVTANATKIVVINNIAGGLGLRVGKTYQGDIAGLGLFASAQADLDYCSFTFSVNTWYYIEVVRSGTTIYFFVDGTQVTTEGTGAGSRNFVALSGGAKLNIGIQTSGAEDFAGKIGPLRLTPGVARHTSNYTPPAAPLPTN